MLEIATVKDSLGEVLEKRIITGIAFNLEGQSMNIATEAVIKRIDGQFVPLNNQTGYFFSETDPSNSLGFTEAEVEAVNNLKNQFLEDLADLLSEKAEVTGE